MPLFFCIAATVEAVEAREGMARIRRETQIISVCACANFKELYQPYGSFLLLHHQKWGRMGPCWEAKNTQWAGSSLF